MNAHYRKIKEEVGVKETREEVADDTNLDRLV